MERRTWTDINESFLTKKEARERAFSIRCDNPDVPIRIMEAATSFTELIGRKGEIFPAISTETKVTYRIEELT